MQSMMNDMMSNPQLVSSMMQAPYAQEMMQVRTFLSSNFA